MGLDRDEIDLYLDAQMQKIDQATDAAIRKRKSKSCPYCGASIPELADKCPECGQFISPEASKELEEILENLEEALVDMKSGRDFDRSKATVERYARKASLYYSNHPKIKNLLVEINSEMKAAQRNNVVGGIKGYIAPLFDNEDFKKTITVIILIVIMLVVFRFLHTLGILF